MFVCVRVCVWRVCVCLLVLVRFGCVVYVCVCLLVCVVVCDCLIVVVGVGCCEVFGVECC